MDNPETQVNLGTRLSEPNKLTKKNKTKQNTTQTIKKKSNTDLSINWVSTQVLEKGDPE
jgi:hypothetical protein